VIPVRVFGVLLAVLLTSGCVAPARSFSAFESKAVDSAESARSDAETAILAADLAARGRLGSATTSDVLQEAAIGAATAAATFATIQPPDPASDALRRELLPELQRAADTIALMQIAARRVDVAAVSDLSTDLRPIADGLERFELDHR
jgi:hypothetical protein